MGAKPCFVCDLTADVNRVSSRDAYFVVCGRCGRYQITGTLAATIRHPGDVELLPYLSAYLRQATARGEDIELSTSSNWQRLAVAHSRTPVHRKLDLVLRYFGERSKYPGAQVTAGSEDFPLFDAPSSAEVNYLVDGLVEQGHLRQTGPSGNYVVTPQGWQRLSPMDPGGVPGTCFVAMAFDPSLSEIYESGIKQAAESCGLAVVRVDKIEHNGIVTDLIMGEIRRAQVIIADVTLQRQGVYFEAGFALGLGRLVIWSCREDEMSQVHFDTRQYSHVTWRDVGELKTKLEARIRSTVPIPVKS